MYTITKEFEFSASHQLAGLPDGHPCGRLHGHNYKVTVELQTETLNAVGFVRDYGDLGVVKELIDRKLDHRHLNDVLPKNPTAEHLAEWIFSCLWEFFPELVAVRVSETPKTWAEYRRTRPIATPLSSILIQPGGILVQGTPAIVQRIADLIDERLKQYRDMK